MPRCSEEVYHGSGVFNAYQCTRNGVIEPANPEDPAHD